MIKSITQYVVVCDNSFCDSVVKAVVDFHSYDRREQFEGRLNKLGWKIQEEDDRGNAKNFICPDCILFSSELEKRSLSIRAIRKSA